MRSFLLDTQYVHDDIIDLLCYPVALFFCVPSLALLVPAAALINGVITSHVRRPRHQHPSGRFVNNKRQKRSLKLLAATVAHACQRQHHAFLSSTHLRPGNLLSDSRALRRLIQAQSKFR